MLKSWKAILAGLFVAVFACSGLGFSQPADDTESGSEAYGHMVAAMCSNPVCLRWQIRYTAYEFRYVEEIRQQADGSWKGIKKYKQNGLQFLQNGPQEWTNGLAKFADLDKAVTNKTVFAAPITCFEPPCRCILNANPGPFNTDNKWHSAESSPYQATLGGKAMMVRAVARYKYEERIVDGKCTH